MKLRNFLILPVLIALTACAGANLRNQADKLNTALTQYGVALRWAHYNQAISYHVNREGERALVDMDHLARFNITGFRPVDPVVNEDGSEATIPIEIDYYDKEYGTLRNIREIQYWWFDEESNRWLIESDFPSFR
jgi:hypothetical protein